MLLYIAIHMRNDKRKCSQLMSPTEKIISLVKSKKTRLNAPRASKKLHGLLAQGTFFQQHSRFHPGGKLLCVDLMQLHAEEMAHYENINCRRISRRGNCLR
jgi:hypothetical protein